MVNGIIGKKIGMTQIFSAAGIVIPVTILRAGPCIVVQRKTVAVDGYSAIQLGFVEDRPLRNVTKPMKGHFEKTGKGAPPVRILREFDVDSSDEIEVGAKVLVDLFSADELVEVVGTSKGRGFAGVMKRHGFSGGRRSHGSMFHRAPGSIGSSAFPSRVFPGTRMPGHMGKEKKTVKNLKIIRIDSDNGLIIVKGGIPGPNGGYVLIRKMGK